MNERAENNINGDIVAGRNAVAELLRSGRQIEYILVIPSAGGSVLPIISKAKQMGVVVKETTRQKLDLKLPHINHQGIAAIVSSAEYAELDDILAAAEEQEDPVIVILDEIEDPHNLGAIIRTAEAAGVCGIIIPKRRSVGLNATVAKVAVGALEYVPVARVANIAAAMDTLKERGFWIYCADMDGEEVYSVDITGKTALVIGSEGRGVGRLIKEKCDVTVSLPMCGNINSLNASVAAGLMIYEAVRQRKAKEKGRKNG